MKEKKALLGYYDYTVVLTYIGMLFGFIGITMVFELNYQNAVVCLMVAGICDMFDGTIAATKNRNEDEKCFGIQIDSLSDLICFGLLPGLFIYQFSGRNTASFICAGLYVLSALIRLAYFNVCEQQRQKVEETTRKYYQGVPVTTIALFLPAIYLLFLNSSIHVEKALTILLLVMAILFLAPVQIKKPQIIGKISVCLIGILEFVIIVCGALGAS